MEPTIDLDALAPECVAGVRLLPVIHERVDFAVLTRLVLATANPEAVAVELPTTFEEAVHRAIARLPKVSVVLSEDEPDDEALVWVVTPGDPIVEAMRWAQEHERPVFLIDPDVRYRQRHHDPVPDPHILLALGFAHGMEVLRQSLTAAARSSSDLLRERGMAFHIHRAKQGTNGLLLAVVGAAHVAGVTENLKGPTAPPLARSRRKWIELRHLAPESMTAVLPDPPLAHATFEAVRSGRPLLPTALSATVSRRVELVTAGLRLITGAPNEDDAERAESVVTYAALHGTRDGPAGERLPDRVALGEVVWNVASASYAEQTREETAPWQRRLFFDFGRRHARVQGLLAPGLYEWVVAARGVGDDNLAWEVFDAARAYPWQTGQAELATARIDGEMLDLGTRTVRFRRRFLRVKQRPVAVPVRRRPTPKDPAEWLEAFDANGICSYPPEDITVEDYGRFLQKKAISALSAERSRAEPFTTSMLDGIDIRETAHRWHEAKVWVRELGRAPGEAGSVVVIFDEDRQADRYPYLMTWLGEHDQESDMALYATDPTQQIVGPGMMRAAYGGFMVTYPPGRLFDVWRDLDYAAARSKSEVLLMAAIDYSQHPIVVHVAARKPSPRLTTFAASQKKRIVHIPIGSLSPVTLRKIRVVHILAGRDKREIARDYIW